MMVIFTSQSDKKALKTTRWILDAFAERIGNDTWQTIITEDGLEVVKSLLRRHATKSMSVSCRWLRSRSRSELLWIIGDRSRFNAEGMVPVNYTKKDILHQKWENNWDYLPAIKAMAAVAGLLHDWGKCNDAFQKKLKAGKNEGDPFRHEWISCRLIAGLIQLSGSSDDTGWIRLLTEGDFSAKELSTIVNKHIDNTLSGLPPLASMLCWLILSHHRLPVTDKPEYKDTEADSFQDILTRIHADWGYQNQIENHSISFSQGLLQDSQVWQKKLDKWLKRLWLEKDTLLSLWQSKDLRLFLLFTRICLMLADYSVSAGEAKKTWAGQDKLYANTYQGTLKQKLDEHLVRVGCQAARIAHYLPVFAEEMPRTEVVRSLLRKSPREYAWQGKAVERIRTYRKEIPDEASSQTGYFVVNMASTGCGKTFANAKIMQALAADGRTLRYTLTLGLRSLTLQTGNEYRKRIGLGKEDMAVLIGSAAVRKLYEQDYLEADTSQMEDLLPGKLEGIYPEKENFLQIFFDGRKNKLAGKNKALLYMPVVAATIDHIMPATEAVRGGRYMLPLLRMLSSDLVIDEVDDFDKSDLLAIARLIHLTGMLGRNVLISSATIPPDLAEGLFSAYQAGRKIYAHFFKKKCSLTCVWCDEARTQITTVPADCKVYREKHTKFAQKRVSFLKTQLVKRKGTIIPCLDARQAAIDEREKQYFQIIQKAIICMHQQHAVTDKKTGKKVSFGLVRLANITPCVAVGKYLMQADWPEECVPRIMVYHSRQTLLLRHEQEYYLDQVLKRKNENDPLVEFTDPVLRRHLDQADAENVIFIVIATPVEEIGRDHDFDWAVVEPSSYRSLIQLSGRVLRHRKIAANIATSNVAVLQFNFRGLRERRRQVVFCKPGLESRAYPLQTHDMKRLVDVGRLEQGIDASLRVLKPERLQSRTNLSDLEHQVMQDFRDLSKKGAGYLHGWQEESWYLTGIPQKLNPFRAGSQSVVLYLSFKGEKKIFEEYDLKKKEYVERTPYYAQIEEDEISERFWLQRDYKKSIIHQMEYEKDAEEITESTIRRTCHQYGELELPIYNGKQLTKKYHYSDQYGLYHE